MSFSAIINSFKGVDSFNTSNLPYKKLIIGFTIFNFLFERYVAFRQYKLLQKKDKKLPKVLEGKIDTKKFDESDAYGLAKSKFEMFSSTLGVVLSIATLLIQPFVWNYSVFYGDKILSFILRKEYHMNLIASNIAFFILFTLISTLTSFPLSYYQHFVLEEKFGFNKMTKKLFFTDLIKTNLLVFVLASPIIYLLGWILKKCTDNFIFYIWLFVLFLQVTMFLLNDLVIQPMFNKFTPLDNQELKDKIDALAKECGFPLSKIFMVDGSKRSSHSNAYFTGLPFMKKKIVIFDTLIKDSSVDEVVAVLGHEIGHWKMNHITKMLIFSQIHFAVFFKLFESVYKNESLFSNLGFIIDRSSLKTTATLPGSNIAVINDYPFLIGLILFSQLIQPTDTLMSFCLNLFSRHNEYEADKYAADLGKGEKLKTALISLQVANLSTISVDSLFSMYHYSHPTLPERLEAIDKHIIASEKKEN
ncbi:hypothetical protein ACO0SA_004677 [Hanseniaspora valbyensis]